MQLHGENLTHTRHGLAQTVTETMTSGVLTCAGYEQHKLLIALDLQLTVQLNVWFTPALFRHFCRFKLCSIYFIYYEIVHEYTIKKKKRKSETKQ